MDQSHSLFKTHWKRVETNLQYRKSIATFSQFFKSARLSMEALLQEVDFLISQIDEAAAGQRIDHTVPTTSTAPPIELSATPSVSFAASSSVSSSTHGDIQPSSSRFVFQSDEKLQEIKDNSVPKNTARNTAWAVNIWKQWSLSRQEGFPGKFSEWPVHLYIADNIQLDYLLSKFVIEVKKSDSNTYPPNTLYSICCGLLRYVRERRPEVNFFRDSWVSQDSRWRNEETKITWPWSCFKQAEPLSVEEENSLWEQGLLGAHSPQTLLDAMLFLCGMNFALRSGQEHRSLQLTQFQQVE